MELKVGNQWTYLSTFFDSLGNAQFTDTIGYKIIRDTLINSEKWFFVGNDANPSELLTNRSDGLWYMNFNPSGIPGQGAVLIAKYPASVNDTWFYLDSTTAKLAAKDISVNVPSGTYSCFQYSYTEKHSQDVSRMLYFSIGKGYVRNESLSKTNSGRTYVEDRRDLISLKLNKTFTTAKSRRLAFLW
jgi:hypothetical protein